MEKKTDKVQGVLSVSYRARCRKSFTLGYCRKIRLEFYSCISDELDPVLFGPLFDGPLPVDLDAVNDPVVVEAVDTGGQVGQSTIVPDQGGEDVSRHSLQNIRG